MVEEVAQVNEWRPATTCKAAIQKVKGNARDWVSGPAGPLAADLLAAAY